MLQHVFLETSSFATEYWEMIKINGNMNHEIGKKNAINQ